MSCRLALLLLPTVLAAPLAAQSAPSRATTAPADGPWAPDALRLEGDALRRSGAVSLGEALLGRIPGLTAQRSSGTFGALPVVQLRGLTSWMGSNAPLLVVDEVPVTIPLASGDPLRARDGADVPALRLSDIPLADVEYVTILRGAAAAVRYGPRASAGVIAVTTRTPQRGLHLAVSQRVGTAPADLGTRPRRFGLDEAMGGAAVGSAFGAVASPEARAASWQSCRGYCDHDAELFGGARLHAETRARLDAGSTHSRASLSLHSRRTDLPVTGSTDDLLAGRLQLQQSIGDRFTLRVAHLVQQVAGNHPLRDGTGLSANASAGTAGTPSWLNLRGVPGVFTDTSLLWANPLFLARNVPMPRQLSQYVSQGTVDLTLWQRGRSHVSVHGLAGLHRLAQRDGVNLSGIRVGPFADLGVRLLDADVREESGAGWAAWQQALGRHQLFIAGGGTFHAWQRRAVDETRSEGVSTPSSAFTRYEQGGWWTSADLRLGEERLRAGVSVRRDRVPSLGVAEPPVVSWQGTAAWRVVARRSGYAALRVATGQVESHLEAAAGASPTFAGWRERRHDVEAGLSLVAADGRLAWHTTAYRQRTAGAVAVPAPGAPPTARPAALGTLESSGIEGQLTVGLVERPAAWWRTELLVGHTRANFLRSDPFRTSPTGTGVPGAWRMSTPGASPFALWQVRDTTMQRLGNGMPSVTVAHRQDLRRGGWRLTVGADAELGGLVVDAVAYARDAAGNAVGSRARLDSASRGHPVYVRSGHWGLLREVTLSRTISGGILPAGSRLELNGRNLWLQGAAGTGDLSARRTGPLTSRSVLDSPFPFVRTISLALVIGG